MLITWNTQQSITLKLLKAQKQSDALMQLTTSSLIGMFISPDKLITMCEDIEYCLSVPFTEDKCIKAKELLKSPVRQQIKLIEMR